MRICTFIGLFVLAFAVSAGQLGLQPLFTPAPEFPGALLKSRYAGKTLVYVTVSSSGAVKSISVRESSHPQLLAATRTAVLNWRYEPWDEQMSGRAEMQFPVLVLFGAHGVELFTPDITVGLDNTLCAYLTHEVKANKRDFPNEPISKVDVIWYTAEFLASDYVAYRVPRAEQRRRLSALLMQSISSVIRRCSQAPGHRYVEFLPADIRELLLITSPKSRVSNEDR